MTEQNTDTAHADKKTSYAWLWVGIPILLAAIFAANYLVKTKPKAQRKRPPRQTPVVEVIDLKGSGGNVTGTMLAFSKLF